MILADTSAWVEYDRATGSAVDQRMSELIGDDGPLAVTEPVLMEVLAGARDDRSEGDLRRLLARFHQFSFDPAADFEGAARIYRRCRAAGVTPRSLIDCMIATVAWREGASLLARDADVARVAEVVEVFGCLAAGGELPGPIPQSVQNSPVNSSSSMRPA